MTKKRDSDRHKPSRMVRLRASLARQLDLLADRDATSLTELANRAVRELLLREGLWPPAKPSNSDESP